MATCAMKLGHCQPIILLPYKVAEALLQTYKQMCRRGIKQLNVNR